MEVSRGLSWILGDLKNDCKLIKGVYLFAQQMRGRLKDIPQHVAKLPSVV